jgi:hypothetical protein
MSDIKTRKFKCNGCGEKRPCHLEVTEQDYYDHDMLDNLKCVVDETNQTGFNWVELKANVDPNNHEQALPINSVSKQREQFFAFLGWYLPKIEKQDLLDLFEYWKHNFSK